LEAPSALPVQQDQQQQLAKLTALHVQTENTRIPMCVPIVLVGMLRLPEAVPVRSVALANSAVWQQMDHRVHLNVQPVVPESTVLQRLVLLNARTVLRDHLQHPLARPSVPLVHLDCLLGQVSQSAPLVSQGPTPLVRLGFAPAVRQATGMKLVVCRNVKHALRRTPPPLVASSVPLVSLVPSLLLLVWPPVPTVPKGNMTMLAASPNALTAQLVTTRSSLHNWRVSLVPMDITVGLRVANVRRVFREHSKKGLRVRTVQWDILSRLEG